MTDLIPGTVVLVGGGPGDPELMTVAGLHAIQQADVVLYDHLAPQGILASAREDALLIAVGKLPGGTSTPQQDINALLIHHAQARRRVVRLKGGDSFVFGRGGEEWLACAQAGVPVRVIPGLTSATAAPALAGIPVTHRTMAQGFAVVSGHVSPDDPRSTVDWLALARSGVTVVVLMGVRHLDAIAQALQAGGLAPNVPAAVVVQACSPTMSVVRGVVSTIAADARAAGVRAPAITVFGDVAELSLV